MTDHPIIFSPPMIRALIEGRKMQTRRLIKPQPELAAGEYINECHYCKTGFAIWKPDGSCSCNPVKGTRFWFEDRLWVRETRETETHLIPAFFMPRADSRLTLTVTDVRVQRLQEISEEDAGAEGTELTETVREFKVWHASHRAAFAALWNSLHGPGAWDANPWIVALTFTVAHGNIDALPKQAAA